MPHATRQLYDIESGEFAQIDINMVPMIQALWSHDLVTYFCCEGDPSDDLTTDGNEFRGYVLLKQDEKSMRFIRHLFAEYPVFKDILPSNMTVSFDYNPMWCEFPRMCIRFAHNDIPALTAFILAYHPEYNY